MKNLKATVPNAQLQEILEDTTQSLDRALSLEIRPSKLFQLTLEACRSPSKTVKNRAAKLMARLAETHPPKSENTIDAVASLVIPNDRILTWNACITLGHMASEKNTDKVRTHLPRLLKLLQDPSMVTAANAIKGLGLIAASCPTLAKRITKKLVNADHSFRDAKCQSVLAAKVIEAIEASIPQAPVPQEVRTYVTRHLESNRPATARRAQRFSKRLLR